MRPSERPLADLRLDLAELGIADTDLIADGMDVPELRPQLERALTLDAEFRIAVRYFWDEGNPQPSDRTEWYGSGRTPDWGRLPAWEADGPAEASPRRDSLPRGKRGTKPYWRRDVQTAMRMLEAGASKAEIERKTGLSWRRVDNIEKFWRGDPDYEQIPGPIPGYVMFRRV